LHLGQHHILANDEYSEIDAQTTIETLTADFLLQDLEINEIDFATITVNKYEYEVLKVWKKPLLKQYA
jgi:hypothetical protein